jgi:hypothetical protein
MAWLGLFVFLPRRCSIVLGLDCIVGLHFSKGLLDSWDGECVVYRNAEQTWLLQSHVFSRLW